MSKNTKKPQKNRFKPLRKRLDSPKQSKKTTISVYTF